MKRFKKYTKYGQAMRSENEVPLKNQRIGGTTCVIKSKARA